MKNLLTIFLIFSGLLVFGQRASDRTNKIRLDFSKPVNATKLPAIKWELPSLEYTNSEESRVEIKANVTSSVPLKKITLSLLRDLDGEATSELDIPIESSVFTAISKNMFLIDGQNYIQISAENEEGGFILETRSIIVGMDAIADAISIDRKDYAILFATDQYDNWTDLVNPIYDARSIARELEERYGFEVRIVENANQNEVFTTLREYAQINYKPQDQLFIFFAGHGQYDEVFGEGYVVARNSLSNDPSKTSYISHNRLRNNIDNINCEHIALIMDVCFGGTFDPVLAGSRNVYEDIDKNDFIVKKLSMRTRKFLTSGGKEYVSDGIKGSHSPFTVRLLEALKSNGGEDRILTLSELNLSMQKLKTTPRFGSFGSDEANSEFLFIGN